MEKSTVLRLICCIFLLSPVFAKGQFDQGKLLTKNKHYSIPYTNTDNPIFTSGSIKGKTYKFMVDNGAPVFISAAFQKKHHFPIIVDADMKDAGGKHTKVKIVRIDTIKLGPFVFSGIPALVIDLDDSPLSCDGITGNLGSNILRFLFVRFDMQGHSIYLADNKNMPGGKASKSYPITLSGQYDPFIIIQINNTLADTIHFDTGDGSLYNISKRKAVEFAKLFPMQVISKGYGVISMGSSGLGDSFQQMILKPQNISIGGQNIGDDVVYIAGNDMSRFGRRLLNYGVLTLDYINKRFSFEAYKAPHVSPRTDYGFYPVLDGDKLLTGTVWQHSKADQSGIKPGDEITSVNGIKISSLSKCDIDVKIKAQLLSGTLNVIFKTQAGKTIHQKFTARKL